MSDIVSDSEIILTLPILLTSCSETRKRITRLRTRFPPPPSVGLEYCTFFSHHVSHNMGAVESDMVLITLDMGCSSLCFVLNCYFDVIEFVVKCKPDNKAGISDLYIDDVDVDTFQDKRIVVCDPGKRDLLYLGSRKTDEELAMVPEHETEQQRNSRVMNQDKKYKWLRMTQMSWSLKSRMNEKQKRWATKYTEVGYDRNQMIESNEMTIEDANTELSAFAANSATFIDFSNFVVAKLRQVF
ncbi:hypothetical protein P9112_013004 [Eukaryota sp. TZLM1-RC]